MGVKMHLKVQLTLTPNKRNPPLGDTKAHFKIKMNTIHSFGVIQPQSSDADASDDDDDTDDDTDYAIRKSDPYMPPSYAGDTKKL